MLDIIQINMLDSMPQPNQLVPTSNELHYLELAQALMERLTISPNDWYSCLTAKLIVNKQQQPCISPKRTARRSTS